MRRLDDARDLDPELLAKVAVAVMHRDDTGDLGVRELLGGRSFDLAKALRIVLGPLLEPAREIRAEHGQGLLDGIGLLDGVGEGDERVGVRRPAAGRAEERRPFVRPDHGDFGVPGGLDHPQDEIVMANAIDDDRVEVGELLDIVRPGLVVPRVDIAGEDGSDLHARRVAGDVLGPRVIRVQGHADPERAT